MNGLALAQQPGHDLLGDWREPGGSVIRVSPCDTDVCLTLAHIRPDAPSQFDIHNPNGSEHTRRLCGLTIGRAFHTTSPGHADGGTLYDPKTGKTYHGEITAHGNQLDLRGYVGIKAFGRTETWTRTSAPVSCSAS